MVQAIWLSNPSIPAFMYRKKLVFLAACLGMLLFGIGLITLGSIAADLREKFALDEVGAGSLFSILPFGILGGSLVFGPVCDRYGYKTLLVAACLGMAAGFEAMALVSSINGLRIAIFIFGFSAGIINGTTNALVADISTVAKGANLSLLGVFFGIGALGMPFITGLLKGHISSFGILTGVGILTLVVGFFYMMIRFPKAKHAVQTGRNKTSLFRSPLIYMIAVFLFFQGSLESIMNNWTTSYLAEVIGLTEKRSLFALTLFVLGMTLMRLLIGSLFRSMAAEKMILLSMIPAFAGLLLFHTANSYFMAAGGLVLLGAGLAAGFPIMMGLAGTAFPERSGTALSIVLATALTGNMLINFVAGLVSRQYGIRYLSSLALAELSLMLITGILIYIHQLKKNKTYAGKTMVE
jgi:MFS transporter, FHS family, glucose/mannose:H+ symporter